MSFKSDQNINNIYANYRNGRHYYLHNPINNLPVYHSLKHADTNYSTCVALMSALHDNNKKAHPEPSQ